MAAPLPLRGLSPGGACSAELAELLGLGPLLPSDAQEGLAWPDGAALDAAWAAAARGAGAGGDSGPAGFRCLDATHAAGCLVCTPPPPASRERDFELRGAGGRTKNGERRLRAQLSRTREWGSLREREALAAALTAPEDARLAAALRDRRSAALRKGELLRLCRAWAYASDIWAHRKDRPRAPAAQPPAAQRPPALALALPAAAPAEDEAALVAAAHAQLDGPVRALAERALAAFRDTGIASAMLTRLRAPGAPPLALRPATRAALAAAVGVIVGDLTLARDALQTHAAAAAQAHADAAAQHAALPPAQRAEAAWCALRGREHAWEPLARAIGGMVDFSLAAGDKLRGALQITDGCASAAAAGAAPGGADAADEALARRCCDRDDSVVLGSTLVLEMLSQAGSVMARLKASASYDAHLAAGGALLALLARFLAACADALSERLSLLLAVQAAACAAPGAPVLALQ